MVAHLTMLYHFQDVNKCPEGDKIQISKKEGAYLIGAQPEMTNHVIP